MRDASVKTQDMLILDEMDMSVFNRESVRSYRQRMKLSRPGHVWEALEDEDFLMKLGAVGIGSDGQKHPTTAGLLMFGKGKYYCVSYRQARSKSLLNRGVYRVEAVPYKRLSE